MRRFRALGMACLLIPGLAFAAGPIIDGVTAPASVLTGATARVSVQARSDDGSPLTYAWAATTSNGAPAGQVDGTGAEATFTAPPSFASVTVTVTVTNATGSATGSATIRVAAATFRGTLRHGSHAMRVSAAASGELYVLDGTTGEVAVLTRRGDRKGVVSVGQRATAVAPGPGYLFVALASGGLAKVDPASGRILGTVGLGEQTAPVAMAWDGVNARLWLVDRPASRVRVVTPEGATAFTLTAAGATALRAPVAVAIDRAGALAWVAVQSNESGDALFAFDLNGNFVRSALPFGKDLGKITRVGGVGVDPSGNVWVTDMFQDVMQTVSRTGAPVSIVGQFGDRPGDLRQPADVAPMVNGDVVVASSDRGALERYGRGAALPVCAGDADCDGIADTWELAHGMNPNSADDAWLDPDGNGLTNEQEYLASLGTTPGSTATTTMVASAGDTTTSSAAPVVSLVAQPRVESGPGLVALSATLVSSTPCNIAWKQVAGPAVQLRGATTLAPAFVARTPATYRFSSTATCNGTASAPVFVDATVTNAAPRPDAGRTTVVTAPGDAVLDGSLSSDANGDALVLRWDQLLGAPLTGSVQGPLLAVHPEQPGLFEFLLTATDPRGGEDTAQVPLLALSPGAVGPVAVAVSPVLAAAGETVVLDGSRSYPSAGAQYRWSQLDGPAVTLADPASARTSFVAPAAGRYGFELSVDDGEVRSPSVRVDVFVAAPGTSLPVAASTVTGTAGLGLPLQLDGAASTGSGGGAIAHAWRIVSGPASGLTGADGAVATLVPFDSGTFVIEHTVTQGGIPGVPERLRIDVPLPDGTLPVAVARAADRGVTGAPVQLDGSASTGSGPLRYRWTQVGGPWVALDDAAAAAPRFSAAVAGTYEFELEVQDGNVRSAPTRVRVAIDGAAQ